MSHRRSRRSRSASGAGVMLPDGAEFGNVLGEKVHQGEPITGFAKGFIVAVEERWVESQGGAAWETRRIR